MPGPYELGVIRVEIHRLRELVRAARACAEELESEIEAKYPAQAREDQPTVLRRYMRDISVVRKVLEIVVDFETQL